MKYNSDRNVHGWYVYVRYALCACVSYTFLYKNLHLHNHLSQNRHHHQYSALSSSSRSICEMKNWNLSLAVPHCPTVLLSAAHPSWLWWFSGEKTHMFHRHRKIFSCFCSVWFKSNTEWFVTRDNDWHWKKDLSHPNTIFQHGKD